MWEVYASRDFYDEPAMITPWTLVHFASGIVAHSIIGKWPYAFVWWFIIHGLYEIKDITTVHRDVTTGRRMNSLANSLFDHVTGMLGFVFAVYVLGLRNNLVFSLSFLAMAYITLILLNPRRSLNIWYSQG